MKSNFHQVDKVYVQSDAESQSDVLQSYKHHLAALPARPDQTRHPVCIITDTDMYFAPSSSSESSPLVNSSRLETADLAAGQDKMCT